MNSSSPLRNAGSAGLLQQNLLVCRSTPFGRRTGRLRFGFEPGGPAMPVPPDQILSMLSIFSSFIPASATQARAACRPAAACGKPGGKQAEGRRKKVHSFGNIRTARRRF